VDRRRLERRIEGGIMANAGMRLCRLDEIPDGDSRGFDPLGQGRDTLLIVRQGTSLHAWRDACPHLGGVPMAWRKDAYLNAARDSIVCSGHGALFDIATGMCTLGPCLGESLQPVAVMVDSEGFVCLKSA
jgi:nitrite reductase/ring-hydroxylating ferredoxin subunit